MLHTVPTRLALDFCMARLLIHSSIYSKCDLLMKQSSVTLTKITIHSLNIICSSSTLYVSLTFTATWQCQASWLIFVIPARQVLRQEDHDSEAHPSHTVRLCLIKRKQNLSDKPCVMYFTYCLLSNCIHRVYSPWEQRFLLEWYLRHSGQPQWENITNSSKRS